MTQTRLDTGTVRRVRFRRAGGRRRRRQGHVSDEAPRTFDKSFARAVEISPIIGPRSAPYTHGADLSHILEGIEAASHDPEATAAYGDEASMQAQVEELRAILQTDVSGPGSGPAPHQLMRNVLRAYSAETFFGGHTHSILNISLRFGVERADVAPIGKLLHHAVSTLIGGELGFDGVAYRVMRLPPEVLEQYSVDPDARRNVFAWSGFTSCTRSAEVALDILDEFDSNTLFLISSGGRFLRPLCVEDFSEHPQEREVLYDLGQQFEKRRMRRITRTALAQELGLGAAFGEDVVTIVEIKAVDRFHDLVADIFVDGGDPAQAEDICRGRLAQEEAHYGRDSVEVAAMCHSLGVVLKQRGDFAGAKELLERALSIEEHHLGPEHPEVAITLTSLGIAYGNLGDPRRQKELLERALGIFEHHFGPEHPHAKFVRRALAR